MKSTVRTRFWVEAGIASLCVLGACITLVWRDWIEVVTGIDPDNHDGSSEWVVVAGLLVVGVFVAFIARSEWCRPRRLPALRA
jgi:hypothetical protein